MPRSYQVTPKVLGRRRATQAWPVRPGRRHRRLESARRQPENQPQRPDVTAHTRATLTVTRVLDTSAKTAAFMRDGDSARGWAGIALRPAAEIPGAAHAVIAGAGRLPALERPAETA
jgi:hypothetical protein